MNNQNLDSSRWLQSDTIRLANVQAYNLINLGWLIKIFNHQYSSNQVWWTLRQCEEKAVYRVLI